jgi:hypothetical protein
VKFKSAQNWEQLIFLGKPLSKILFLAIVPSLAEPEQERSTGGLGSFLFEVNRKLKCWLIVYKRIQ